MDILNYDLLEKENQIIYVTISGVKAKVYMCMKVNNMWKIILETEGFCGKNGLGKEKEGDLKTPIGLFELGIAFGMHKSVKTKLDYIFINKDMYWICDSNSKYYNEFIDLSNKEVIVNCDEINKKCQEKINLDNCSKKYELEKHKILKDWEDSKTEHLIDENIAYEYAIEIKYNKEKIKDKGSAIFLHCIKNGPTAGCISVRKEDMKFILENSNKDTKILITAKK